MDAALIVQLITAAGLGSVFPALIGYFRDRQKNVSDVNRADTETSLLQLNAVIDQLRKENTRLVDDRDRLQDELTEEQKRNMQYRQRIRELEEEIDGVRRSARETQQKCDELASRLEELVASANED